MEKPRLRHAYLIMAHGSFPILEKQIRFLDSDGTDLFIHVDADAFPLEQYRALPKKSTVTFLERKRVFWGDLSQIECELRLLEAAVPGDYDYYHLLSGVDVPVKSRAYIEDYFSRSNGVNHIKFQAPTISERHLARVKYYYPLQRLNVRRPALRVLLREASVLPQRLLGVDRTKRCPGTVFQKGTNWFDITGELARYVLSRRDEIRSTYRSTCCADEMFLHTLVVNSPFVETLPECAFANDFRACCRYIDWDRGSPYTFTDSDLDELLHTGPDYLFARKFDYAASPGVVDRLFEVFGGEGEA